MVQVLEQRSAPQTIEATLNYIVNNGEKLFTATGGAGGLDVRSGGTLDPRRVAIHDGRPHVQDFVLDRDGFRFVRHDTKVADFFDEDEVRRVYYPEMEALVKAESGAARVVVFDHTLRTADDEMRAQRKIREVVPRVHNDYTEWSGPQRVRDILPDEADDAAAPPLRHHPGVAADPPSGRELSARDLRCAQRLARRSGDFGAALSQPRRPDLRHHLQSRSTNGTCSRACGGTRRSCSRCSIQSRTAAPAGRRTPPSTIRPRRRTRARARASKSAPWRFSERRHRPLSASRRPAGSDP